MKPVLARALHRTTSAVFSSSFAFVLALAVVLAGAGVAQAAEPAGSGVLISPDETEGSLRIPDGRVTASGVPRALYRVGWTAPAGTPESMARSYLAANAAALRLAQPDLADLHHRATRRAPAASTVRFAQRHLGVPVYDAEIAVTVNDSNVVTYVASTYRTGIGLEDVEPAVGADQARETAHRLLGVEGPLGFDEVELVVYASGGTPRLAHRVRFEPQLPPHGTWEVLVDAENGEVFRAQDRSCHAPVDGDGNVFDPDPLSSAGATYGDPGYVDGADADTPQLNAELVNVTLRDIDETGGTFSLVGPWAEVQDFESPFKGLFTQGSSTFNFNRFDDAFEAVNTYYHIDHTMRHINVTLGFALQPYQYATGVRFDPSGLSGSDNSHYLTGTGRLAFGEGGVDDAEDADVIIHELGHGIHDWVTVGGLSQVNGLSEGVGDYFAVSYSRSLGQWAPADPQFNWVFSWDGHNPFWNGRITNYGALYPGGLINQVHTDGQIWATANMLIWDQIGRNRTDLAMLAGLAMTGSGTNQEDAAQAVLQAALDMGYSGTELMAIQNTYQARGYDVSVVIPLDPIFEDGFESGDTSLWTLEVEEPDP